jgi:hypothetical protein
VLLKLKVGCRNVSYRWCLSSGMGELALELHICAMRIGSVDDFELCLYTWFAYTINAPTSHFRAYMTRGGIGDLNQTAQ